MQIVPSVDRRVFLNTVDALAHIGVDLPDLCEKRGLANPLDETGERIPLSKVSVIYDCVADEINDAEYVYKVANQTSLAGGGTMFQLMTCCRTLFDAIRLACRFSSIASDVVSVSFHERNRYVDLLFTENQNIYVSLHQREVIPFLLTRFQQMTPAACGQMMQEVWFMHAPRFPIVRYEKYFGCSVLFHQQRNGVRFLRGALDTPLPGADERLQAYFSSVAERYESNIGADDLLQTRVQRLFVQRMAFGDPDRKDIAQALNMSISTLQRRLRECGLSYRELIEQTRLAAAKQELLTSERPVHEVACLIGYADVRGFRRAFQRATGCTPADFRHANRK